MRLKDKTAIITGAGSGLGEAIARRFAAEGASLLLCDKNARAVQALSEELSAQAPGVLACEADVSDSAAVGEMAESCLRSVRHESTFSSTTRASRPRRHISNTPKTTGTP